MSLLEATKNLKGLVRPKTAVVTDAKHTRNDAVIDGVIFQLHYRVTSGILFMFSALTTSFNLVGKPMTCFLSGKEAKITPEKFIDSYCWVEKTFTLPNIEREPELRKPYPGIGPDSGLERKYHAYYQWVPLMLFLQALQFYAPRWFWKYWERRKMYDLSKGLREPCLAPDRTQKTTNLASYVQRSLGHHGIYALCYYFCEFWNFFNVITTMYVIDDFLGGSFMTYGSEVLTFKALFPHNRTDPMYKIFPLVTKCHLYKYGPTGSLQLLDAMCLLSVNLYNEKLYVFLWFWLVACAILSSMAVIRSVAFIIFPSLRVVELKRKFETPPNVAALIRKSRISEYFFLYLLSENLDALVFQDILIALSRHVKDGGIRSISDQHHLDSNDDHPIIFPTDKVCLQFNPNVASVRKPFLKILKGRNLSL